MSAVSAQPFLPIEILRNIIGQADLPSLKALRLASSTFATIGAEYLLPEVHLLYRTTSLERLGEISRHPIISQHVTTLFYEADRLNHFVDRDQWETFVTDVEWFGRCPEIPPFTASREVWNAHHVAFDAWSQVPHHSYTELELARGWATYLDICAEQQDIATRNLDHDQIARAILCFPKLSHIYLSTDAETRPFSNAFGLSYTQGLIMPQGDCVLDPDEPAGFRQFKSLALFAPEKIDLHPSPYTYTQQAALRTLHLGAVSWKILSQTGPAQQALYQTTMAHVTDLNLILKVRQPQLLGFNKVFDCQRFFRKTEALRIFLTAAPNLEKLHVHVKPDLSDRRWKVLDFSDLVGDGEFTWEALREVSFSVNTSEGELIAFLTRHQKTLRSLTMEDGLTLLESGASEATLLLRMRDAVEWEEISLGRSLFVVSSRKEWDLGLPGGREDDSEAVGLGQEVEDFLMRRSDVNPFELRGERI